MGGCGGMGGLHHYGPRGRNGLQLLILVGEQPLGRDFRQGHRLEQAAQGEPVDHLGALATAPRHGPAVRCRGIASWKGRTSHSP